MAPRSSSSRTTRASPRAPSGCSSCAKACCTRPTADGQPNAAPRVAGCMSLAALAFAAGAAALQLQAALPALGWSFLVLVLVLVGLRYRAALVAAACAAGFFWAAGCAQWRMSD